MLRAASLVARMGGLSLANGPAGSSPVLLKTVAAGGSSANQIRSTSFLVKVSAEDLWKGVTSVSNAGRKRGRASGASRKMSKDLNRGQMMGVGKVNMIWPGLNAPVVRGKELVERSTLPPDADREQRLLAIRNRQLSFKPLKLSPLERGWSGTKAPGRPLGPPDPVGEEDFSQFQCTTLELKMVATMKGHLGRQRRHKAVVLVGNGKGLIGFASCKAPEGRSALRKAKNMAIKRLCHFDLFENHTVLHDFYTEYGSAKIIVKKKQHGYGLVCHRVIKEVCKAVGIKDLYAKLDVRSSSPLCILRAFLLGLHRQKSHQEVADAKRLLVVEYRQENDYFPKVIAVPQTGPVRSEEEFLPNEELDYDMVMSDGKLVLEKPKKLPFYMHLPCWENHLKKADYQKNKREVRMRLLAKYGALESFLTIREKERLAAAASSEADAQIRADTQKE